MVKIKICGLTNLEDALKACEYGADLLGFLFAPESPRYVDAELVKKIIKEIPRGVEKVGLFKDQALDEVVKNVMDCGLSAVQLHGNESPEYCGDLIDRLEQEGRGIKVIKTFKVKYKILASMPLEAYEAADYYLFDTFHPKMMGGTGVKFDWEILKDFKGERPFFLAGGLTPGNVEEAIKKVRPYGVDVSSGVERAIGEKDEKKVKEFIQNAKKA